MKISENGLRLIMNFEGCRLTAYDDLQPNVKITNKKQLKGTLTIGYGHTASVKIGQTITQREATDLLISDLKRYERYVNDPAFVTNHYKLNQNQYDALVSFCYNCGAGNLKKLCYNKSFEQIATDILKYNKSKGIILNGLVRRRTAERDLFISPVKEGESEMQNQKEQIEKLEKRIESLTNVLQQHIMEQPCPEWLLKEFPDALTKLSTKTGTNDFWRAYAIALRLSK